MPTQIVSERVMLNQGCVVSRQAFDLLCDLERRELVIEREGDQLTVGPRTKLTDNDRAQIRQHRDELLMLVDYCETVQ